MIKDLRFVAAQINPIVGDFQGNTDIIKNIWDTYNKSADLIIFPEMSLTGYPLEDLVFRLSFLKDVEQQIEKLTVLSNNKDAAILIGAPIYQDNAIYNAVCLIEKGTCKVILKWDLSKEGVYDEPRVFANGPLPDVVEFRGHKLGILICQDIWTPTVANHLKAQGAECLISPNGSTFEVGKMNGVRKRLVKQRVQETGLPLLYLNFVGGQDEVVFDGASFVMQPDGHISFQLNAFEVHIAEITMDKGVAVYPEENKSIYIASVLGLRDYIQKSGFQKVLLGLSGGVDSALTATIAVDALGAENVHCVLLPSNFTSDASNDDALELIEALGVSHETISILPAMEAFEGMIDSLTGLAHENMQARARGVTLMSLSNKTGALLLSTGNKSEIAVGYSTLYGDACGAFNPIKDMYKTKVFELCHLRNRWKPKFALGKTGHVIPEQIITKPPSAELRDDQKDEDSLPPYDVLDQILELFVEQEQGIEDVIANGFEAETVRKVYKLLHMSEYKRRQSCPGVNVTTKPFGGRHRRYPIVNKY